MKIKKFFRTFLLLSMAAICFLTGCGGNTQGITTAAQATTQSSTSASITQATPQKPTKRVALTFDDGPHNDWTILIAQELEKYGFHATFFVVGNRVGGAQCEYNGKPAVTYLYQNGHEIGIHGYTHKKHYDTCTDADYAYEINETVNAVKSHCSDYEAKLMRPIGGSITDARIAASPYSIIKWSVDSEDWNYKGGEAGNVDKIVENVMSSVKDGDIILMHDIYENTYEAVKIILARLQAEGYEVVTVSELLGEPQPGTKYSHK